MKSLRRLNKYFYRYRWRLALGVVFVALSNYFRIASTEYFGSAVDQVTANKGNELLRFTLIILGLAAISGFFLFLMRQAIIVLSRLMEYDLKNDIYKHYQELDLAFYRRNNTGDLMNRISEDVSRVRMYIGPAIMYVVNTLFTFAITIVAMLSADVKLTVYVLLPLPVLALSIYYVSELINRRSTKVQEQLSVLTTRAQEAFSGIRVLKAFGREKFSEQQMAEECERYRKTNLGLVKTEALFHPFMIMLIGMSTILTIYIGGKQAFKGEVTYGDIAAFVIYINNLTWPIASLGWVTSLIQRAAASQTRINEFLDTKPGIVSGESTLEPRGSIEFRNLSFVYPDSGIKALNNVSFKVPSGGSLAVIGKTGSGKSTLAYLLGRLYDPTSGELLIDNNNIKLLNIKILRNSISYVPQDVFLFSDTISNNISFGYTGDPSKLDKDAIQQAAKDAAIYANIMEFPAQFETLIGERGITLSGGQKQRVSIARALLRPSSILVFDDCLSAVDTETEDEILRNLKGRMQNKTSIIISHRVSSVKHADQIIVLDNGSILEEGSHEQLLEKKGAYFELYRKQLIEAEKRD